MGTIQTFSVGPGGTLVPQQTVVDDTAIAAGANRQTLLAQASAAMDTLQGYIDQAPVTITTVAQAQTVCRGLQAAVQFEAQALRRLIRLAANQLDSTT